MLRLLATAATFQTWAMEPEFLEVGDSWKPRFRRFESRLELDDAIMEACSQEQLSLATAIKYGPLRSWDVSGAKTLKALFAGIECRNFNRDISGWHTGGVIDMTFMFSGASQFNQPIGDWNTGNVKSMIGMFAGASHFNGDISKWDVASVRDMYGMFTEASSFNRDISPWLRILHDVNVDNMFEGLSSEKYTLLFPEQTHVCITLATTGEVLFECKAPGSFSVRNLKKVVKMVLRRKEGSLPPSSVAFLHGERIVAKRSSVFAHPDEKVVNLQVILQHDPQV